MQLIGIKNTSTQTVLADGIVNVGSVYRRAEVSPCKTPTFLATANGVTLNRSGIYHLTATFVASAPAAGVVSVQMLLNGAVVDGAIASETITTATTELRTLVIDYYILVDKDLVLDTISTVAQTVTFENVGDDATFDSVVVNIDKVV